MAYVQTNSLSSTEDRLLEGEKGLAYWCMLAIQHSLFFLLILSFPPSLFCYLFFLSSFSFFLSAYPCSDVVILS